MSRRPGLAVAAALALVLLGARGASAHSQPFSWVDLTFAGGRVHGVLVGHVVDVAHEAGVAAPESLASPGFLAANRARITTVFSRALRLRADGDPLAPAAFALRPLPERHAVEAVFDAASAPAELQLDGPLFRWEAQHETYFNVTRDGALVHQDVLDQGHPTSVFRTGRPLGLATVVRRFVFEGVHHIFIGPDHILFIVGLLLLGGGVKRLAKIVTAFTAAHSVTLALATLGLVNPPARIVEPLIALSIVVVGIENLLGAGKRDVRPWLAFGFGFIHGFGFANVLREMSLPREALGAALLSFNAGVEIGQLTIVLALAPVLGWLRARRPAIAPRVLVWGSAAVIAAGSWWFVERTLLGS